MKQTALIVLLALAGFAPLSATAADAPVAEAAAPENLSAPGKPCNKPGMGMGGMQGMSAAMPGKMMMGEHRPCPKQGTPCAQKYDKGMSERVEQLEKRLDALQLTVELLARQQGK